jgi:hypothetical protein
MLCLLGCACLGFSFEFFLDLRARDRELAKQRTCGLQHLP